MTVFLLYVPVLHQIGNRTLDRAFGKAEIGGNSLYARPAFALGGGHALEVHIDGFRPVRQAVVSVDSIKIANGVTSYVLMCVVGLSAALAVSSLFFVPPLFLGYFA